MKSSFYFEFLTTNREILAFDLLSRVNIAFNEMKMYMEAMIVVHSHKLSIFIPWKFRANIKSD